MPPRIMFKAKDRPSGMEFASCIRCNHGTRAADAAAGFFARIDPFGDNLAHWKIREARRPFNTLQQLVPGFIEEVFGPGAAKPVLLRSAGGILVAAEEIRVGPVCQALMTVFAAKLGMAFYHEHIGEPLPSGGGVYTLCFLNTGPEESQVHAFLSILPTHNTLRQGFQRSATGQFDYRFNTDEKSVVATLSHFHGHVHIFALATSQPEMFSQAFPLHAPFSGLIRMGELLDHMPKQRPAIVMRR